MSEKITLLASDIETAIAAAEERGRRAGIEEQRTLFLEPLRLFKLWPSTALGREDAKDFVSSHPRSPRAARLREGKHMSDSKWGGPYLWPEQGSQMTPPDSGEREVCGFVFDGMNGKQYSCNRESGHTGPHVRVDPFAGNENGVTLPLPLAQRILAALEEHRERALAAELRDRVEGKA